MKNTGLRIPNIGLLFFVFFCFFSATAPEAAALISIEDETKMGQMFADAVRKRFDVVQDDFINQYMNDLGQYLNEGVETKYFPLHLSFINDDTLNGFAGPGGHIYIFTGLLDTMNNADELAAVLCHEMAHVSSRHIAQRIERNKRMSWMALAGLLAGAVIGGKPGTAVTAATPGILVQNELNNSREDERDADQLSYAYMVNAGFDPGGILVVLKNLSRGNYGIGEQIPPYLLTHPTGAERVSNIEIILKNFHPKPKKQEVIAFQKTFPFVKAMLRAKYQNSKDAERWFRQDLVKDPKNGVAYFGLGVLSKEHAEYDQAIAHFRKALESLPKSIPVLRNLGETYLLKGEYESALRIMNRAMEIDGRNTATLMLLAGAYVYMERYQKAAEIYEKIIALDGANEDTYYQLGIAYGRLDKLGLAHYYFGIHFQRLRQPDKAKFHFDKALNFAKDDSALRSRIEKAMKE